ncbi:hypothetical protein LJR129_005069 [Acidovorax sp. LjRoot129]|uniref:hypothetical protein n=1 Tax=unclassified Acidovorax TaxID=2684926 RepID=UPI003ECC51ED
MKTIWVTSVVAVFLVMGLRLLTAATDLAVDESSQKILAEESAEKTAAEKSSKPK